MTMKCISMTTVFMKSLDCDPNAAPLLCTFRAGLIFHDVRHIVSSLSNCIVLMLINVI